MTTIRRTPRRILGADSFLVNGEPILRVLRKRKHVACSHEELAEATGLGIKQVRWVVSTLRLEGRLFSFDVQVRANGDETGGKLIFHCLPQYEREAVAYVSLTFSPPVAELYAVFGIRPPAKLPRTPEFRPQALPDRPSYSRYRPVPIQHATPDQAN